MLPDSFPSFTSLLGSLALLALPLFAIVRALVLRYVEKSIDAKIEEGVQVRLVTFKAELDERATHLKSSLDREAERLRSALSREASDFSIWAQKRHEATAGLFAAFLRCETKAIDLREFALRDSESMSSQEITLFIERRPELAAIASEIQARHAAKRYDWADELMQNAMSNARRTRINDARNEAYEAYYAHALYLADSVERAAAEVRDQFHAVLVDYMAPDERPAGRLKNKNRLRFSMLELMNAARADLGRSALSPAPVESS